MNFEDPSLVRKHGNWMRVQVAFYDFLFTTAAQMRPTHFNEMAADEVVREFRNGRGLYEKATAAAFAKWPTAAQAWNDFVASQRKEG